MKHTRIIQTLNADIIYNLTRIKDLKKQLNDTVNELEIVIEKMDDTFEYIDEAENAILVLYGMEPRTIALDKPIDDSIVSKVM